MERITITVDEDLLREIDTLSEKRGYKSRSEIFRDMAREALAREATDPDEQAARDEPCFGTLTYVYDHGIRDLPIRLTDNHHAHHALSIATTHVHLNHDNCLEVSILSGTADNLRTFADSVISQRGVRYGKLHIMPLSGADGHGHTPTHSHHHHDDHDH